jgi:hypothetical protein
MTFAAPTLALATMMALAPRPAHALDLSSLIGPLIGLLSTNDVEGVLDGLIAPDGVIAAIEAEINLQADLIDDLDIDIVDLRGSLDTVEIGVANLVTVTGDLTASVEGHQIAIDALTQTTTTHATTLVTHTDQIASLQTAATTTAATLLDHGQRLDSLDARMSDGFAALASGIDRVNQRVDVAHEGVAMAMALSSPYVPEDKTFAISGGWGTFEGKNAFGLSGAVRATEYLQFDAGVAYGASTASVGGRMGATLAW